MRGISVRTSLRFLAAIAVGAALVTGPTACSNLPDIDPSRLPQISLPSRPSQTAEPQPTETVTEAPEPEATAPTESAEPGPTAAPEEDPDESSTVWWPWALLAAALLIAAIVWGRWLSTRRAWDRRLDASRTQVSWLEDSVVAQVVAKLSAAEAAATWQSAMPRVLEIDRHLHALIEDAPSDDRRADAQRGSSALAGLVAALDQETAAHAGTDADTLRARRAALDSARTTARAWAAPPKK